MTTKTVVDDTAWLAPNGERFGLLLTILQLDALVNREWMKPYLAHWRGIMNGEDA